MRNHANTWRWVLIGLAMVIAGPSLAQTPDLFQSAPGPEAPKPRPRPLVSRPPPEPQILQPVAPFLGWDGIWLGNYLCAPDQNNQAFSAKPVIEVKNGRIELLLNQFSEVPGAPGYVPWSGEIGVDGTVSIQRTGIAGASRPGAPHRQGEAFSERIDGRFGGDRFVGRVVSGTTRECQLEMTRLR